MKNCKRILNVFLAFATVFSLLITENVVYGAGENDETNRDEVDFPVEIFDVDADGLFFEYALNSKMASFNDFGVTDPDNKPLFTAGLVSPELGEDGNPVYTKEAIESAANAIYDILNTNFKLDKNTNTYDVFKYFVTKTPSFGQTYENCLDKQTNENGIEEYFYDRGWELDGVDGASGTDGEIHTGKGIIWQHHTDGVINKGYKDHLTKEIDVTKNTKYTFSYWMGNESIKFQIRTIKGDVLLDSDNEQKINTFNSGENDRIILDIYKEQDDNIEVKFAIPKLTPKGGKEGENLLGFFENNTGETFITKGWKSSEYDEVATKTEDALIDGKKYFEQSGDGVVCLEDNSSIVLNTDIASGQIVSFNYWLENSSAGAQIQILDTDNTPLTEPYTLDGEGFNTTDINVPEGNGCIKVKFIGGKGSRIAALTITPLGVEFPLGNYSETESKYTGGQLNKVEDCTSCMDYAYLRLKNFFNTDFYLNKKTDLYHEMVLKAKIENGQKYYSFIGVNNTIFDKQKQCFYNDENGENRSGFFPLDEIEGNGEHNYHFGMKVNGSFIYQSGKKEFFNFSGDDDVYIFINGKLAVDLGGAHTEAQGNIDMEEFVKEYNSQPGLEEKDKIKNGQKCTLDMFYLERHTTESHCKIASNLQLDKLLNVNN